MQHKGQFFFFFVEAMGDKQNDLIRTFNEITGCMSIQEAKKILNEQNWNLQSAVGVYFAKSSEGRSSNVSIDNDIL
jgi:hypothetical protein